jgi:hypothetical protein
MSSNEQFDSDALSTSCRKDLFTNLIASGRNVRQAAKGAGVSESAGYRWSREPKVINAVRRRQQLIATQVIGKLASIGVKAVANVAKTIDADDPKLAAQCSLAVIAYLHKLATTPSILEPPTVQREIAKNGEEIPQWLGDPMFTEAMKNGTQSRQIDN